MLWWLIVGVSIESVQRLFACIEVFRRMTIWDVGGPRLKPRLKPNSNENHEETSLAADNSIESLLILSDYDEKALIPSTILNEIMLHEFLRATPKTNANKLESMQQTAEKKPN